MVSLNYTLLIQLVNFLLLIFILHLILYKPILSILDKRRERFRDTEEEIMRLTQAIEERMIAYEEKVRTAKMDALEKKAEILKDGALQAKAIIDAAKGQIPVIMEQFHKKMNEEVGEARRILGDQSRKISLEIAEKLLGRSIK